MKKTTIKVKYEFTQEEIKQFKRYFDAIVGLLLERENYLKMILRDPSNIEHCRQEDFDFNIELFYQANSLEFIKEFRLSLYDGGDSE